tara:strand:+ start:75 stop:1148 length:1074 start_codon:yes stop_codon:yes gene_type:complete
VNYIHQITFLRFLAAILIVIFHSGKETYPFNLETFSPIVNQGSIAVSFFFFLSGVVLSLNYIKKTTFNSREFFIKRFARLYPVYVLAFIATLILGMIFNNAFPKGVSILLQLFSLHAWFPGICLEINYPSWSIAVEVFFYILFPLVLVLQKRIGDGKMAIFIISFWLLSSLQHYYFSDFLYDPNSTERGQFILYFPLWHFNTFLAGILCGRYIDSKTKQNRTNFTQPRILYVIGTIAFFVILGTDNIIKPYTHNGLMSPVFFLIVAGLSTDKSLVTKFLGNRLFILLGNVSYSIYLFQWPIAICLMSLLGLDKLDNSHFYIYLFTLIIFSVIIYIGFEKKMKQIIINKLIKTKHNKT